MDEFQFAKQMDVKAEADIGAPPYLNTKPLIFGLEHEVKFAVPSRLTSLFEKRQLQVVLAPIVEFFKNNRTLLLPQIAIASNGPVESVRFYYKGLFENIKKVAVDSSSKTSELLLRLILAKQYSLNPEFISTSCKIDFENSVYDGMLVIGDAAFDFTADYPYLDLGECWQEMAGLPFVYACWMVDKDYDARKVYKSLIHSKETGIKNIDRIANQNDLLSPKSAQKYLKQSIRYDLGDPELEGIRTFQKLLKEAGLLDSQRGPAFAAL